VSKILVVVDYQNDFVSGSLGFYDAQRLESGIVKKIREYLNEGNCVFFTLDVHTDDYLDTREGKYLPIKHCMRNTDGVKLYGQVASFAFSPHVTTVSKSSFGAKDLPVVIKEKVRSVDEIEICGIVTNMCVISNAVILQSHFKNAQIKILSSLCASSDKSLHEKAIDIMRGMQFQIIP